MVQKLILSLLLDKRNQFSDNTPQIMQYLGKYKREIKMVTAEEIKLFDKKLQKKNYCKKQGDKILEEKIRRIKAANNNLDNWSDYSAWDNWDRTG